MAHIPNPESYRPLLGKETNQALFRLVQHRNQKAIMQLSVNDYLRKMIAHWYSQEFPDEKFPIELKPYIEDIEIVQST